MKTKGTTPNKLYHLMNCLLFGLIAILIIIPSASFAELVWPTIISPPPEEECPSISLSVDASPAITFTWDLGGEEWTIEKFEMNVSRWDPLLKPNHAI